MDPLRLFDWKNSLEAIDELEKLLQCTVCGKVAVDPQCLGRCDHHFCRQCAEELKEGTCPLCKVPAPPCEMQPDRIISDLIASCRDLHTLITGRDRDRESSVGPAGLCTTEDNRSSTPLTKTNKKGSSNNNNINQNSSSHSNKNSSIITHNKQGIAKNVALSGPTRNKKGRGAAEEESGKDVKKPKTQKTSSTKAGMQGQASTTMLSSGPKPEKRPKMTMPVATEAKKNLKVAANLSVLGMSPSPSTINRRNAKGETLLHVACIKGDKEKVKQLLLEGANPNTRDNAGWTPLHEVCSHGFEDIAELLLHHGAVVDPVGGSNETPLHDAVVQGQLGLVRLLRAWGASDTSRNLQGHTPRSLAALCHGAKELKAALDTPVNPSLPHPTLSLPLLDKMILLGTGLSQQQTKKLETLARMLRVKLVMEYSPEVTHIVMDCTPERLVSIRMAKYMMGVVAGKWILSHTWMDECLRTESPVSPAEHEVLGCGLTLSAAQPGAPALGRANAEKLRPGLFSGCHVFLWGSFPVPSGRKEVEGLVRAGGGVVLAREPNAEAIVEEERWVPFHASPNSPLAHCSHYIIYPDNPSQHPLIKYDMSHIKSLPLAWLYCCVDSFDLVLPVK